MLIQRTGLGKTLVVVRGTSWNGIRNVGQKLITHTKEEGEGEEGFSHIHDKMAIQQKCRTCSRTCTVQVRRPTGMRVWIKKLNRWLIL